MPTQGNLRLLHKYAARLVCARSVKEPVQNCLFLHDPDLPTKSLWRIIAPVTASEAMTNTLRRGSRTEAHPCTGRAAAKPLFDGAPLDFKNVTKCYGLSQKPLEFPREGVLHFTENLSSPMHILSKTSHFPVTSCCAERSIAARRKALESRERMD